MKISTLSTLLSTLILGLSSKTPSVEAFDCGTFESKMVISINNDAWANSDTEWVLEKDNGMGGWIEEESNDLPRRNILYVDNVCLDPNTTYRWTITDDYGDGLIGTDPNPIEIKVNDEVIFEEPYGWWWSLELTFTTPGNPETGSIIIFTESPSSSPSSFPSVSSAPSFACGPDQPELYVEVQTDSYYSDNSWALAVQDEATLDWTVVATKSFDECFTLYRDLVCLETDSAYRWSITDRRGGILQATLPIRLFVNGEMIYEENKDEFWDYLEVVFVTPSDPDGSAILGSYAPSGAPTQCGFQILTINVQTGCATRYVDNDWIFEKQRQDDDGGWEEVMSKSLTERYEEYEDMMCLEPSSTYRWTITDRSYDSGTGVKDFSLFVDDTQIFQEDYDGWYSLEVVFVTPSDPSDPIEILTESPSISPTVAPTRSFAPSGTPTESSAPSNGPTDWMCTDGAKDSLKIVVYTDSLPWETYWVLEEKDPITSNYFQIASNSLFYANTVHEDKICLEPGVSYRWTLTDDWRKNGFNCNSVNPNCGYSVRLNGEEIVSNGRMFDKVVKEIGPVDCSENVRGFHRVVNPRPGRNKFKRVYCSGLLKQIRKTESNEACFVPLIDRSGYLYDKCKKICGRVGAGPCAV